MDQNIPVNKRVHRELELFWLDIKRDKEQYLFLAPFTIVFLHLQLFRYYYRLS